MMLHSAMYSVLADSIYFGPLNVPSHPLISYIFGLLLYLGFSKIDCSQFFRSDVLDASSSLLSLHSVKLLTAGLLDFNLGFLITSFFTDECAA
jgi:hypothetical protein